MESIQRVAIRAEVSRQVSPTDRPLEHSAQCYAVDDATADAKANNAPRELIHHDQHPMRSQSSGLASEQIAAPQAVFAVGEKSEPGRAIVGFRPVTGQSRKPCPPQKIRPARATVKARRHGPL